MTFALIFDSVGAGEWLVLLAVILVVVGPQRLPSSARKFGQWYAKFRRAAETFKRQIMDMDSEVTQAVRDVKNEVQSAAREVEEAFKMPEPTPAPEMPVGETPAPETPSGETSAGGPAEPGVMPPVEEVVHDGH